MALNSKVESGRTSWKQCLPGCDTEDEWELTGHVSGPCQGKQLQVGRHRAVITRETHREPEIVLLRRAQRSRKEVGREGPRTK